MFLASSEQDPYKLRFMKSRCKDILMIWGKSFLRAEELEIVIDKPKIRILMLAKSFLLLL